MRNPPCVFTLFLLTSIFVLAMPSDALAQYSVPSQASQSTQPESHRHETALASSNDDDLTIPEETTPWEIGASFNFLTNEEPSLGNEDLAFTDVMLLRLHALVSTRKYDFFAGSDILPKQPSFTNEHPWQGSSLGARRILNEDFGVWARAQGGPQLGRGGYWLSGDAAVHYQYSLQKFLFFESALGVQHTHLRNKGDREREFFVSEAFTNVGISVRCACDGRISAWLNFDYFYPIIGRPTTARPDAINGSSVDPQPRVNVHFGVLFGVTDNVDLFMELSQLDRGDLGDAESGQALGPTNLPILNGGFDQTQTIFGFMRHFGQ